MLHGHSPGPAGQFRVFDRSSGVLSEVALTVVKAVSLCGQRDFDFSELAIVSLVRWDVREGVVVRSLFDRGFDGLANGVGTIESFSAGGDGELVESVAFVGFAGQNLQVLRDVRRGRDDFLPEGNSASRGLAAGT